MDEDLKIEILPGTDAGKPAKDYVRETEEMLGLKFTPDFLAFLENHNGGVPKKRYFKYDGGDQVVERFLCVYADYAKDVKFGQFDIGVVWSSIEDRLNEYLMPFAALFAGDFLCFDYENKEEPSVVVWVHDLSGDRAPETEPVADNFRQFLSTLTGD
jgi:hypothetical protein